MRCADAALLLTLVLTVPGQAAATSTNQPLAAATRPEQSVEDVYQQLMERDDEALEEIDRWIREEHTQAGQGAAVTQLSLKARILERVRPVREAYDDFLKHHPEHARARLAYGSFLMEIGEEEAAVEEMERSRKLDPKNPAAWNNLANHYGHRGPVKRAFEYYVQAIELNPREPVYYQNFATTVFLFRVDAAEHFHLTESQVFEKSLDLYRQALKLDPTNFVLASDYAQSFYGIRPSPTNNPTLQAAARRQTAEAAIEAWEYALKIAADDLQREGVRIHLARNYLLADRLAEARRQLVNVTNDVYRVLKTRVLRSINDRESKTSEALRPGEAAEAPPRLPSTKEPPGRPVAPPSPP